MEKKRESHRESILTLFLIILGVTVLSSIGQYQGMTDTTGYAPAVVRGWDEHHTEAWAELGNKISRQFSNQQLPSSEIKRSAGEIIQQTTVGYFVKIANRNILFVQTTQSFKKGDQVIVEYRMANNNITPLRMYKA